ncbi:uncharacterized protein LOC125677561 isoform X2 [Ostrea edulis]|uniref:uncharacterized protein LOC125677561 isoform X2 n=1 Tax=Ostrea edulis TaxID=37623 RepID=UPI0024AF2242|nr:uncharacterized protein LOC125677561 isoform X2 [Ostrea edulis]
MKCESYKTCGGEPCVYHCAMNPWGNATVEVCAPETLITGYYCPHFSTGVGRILEHYSYPCKDCPFNYLSTTSYKYKSCYNFIKTSEETKQIATATEQQTAKGISTAFVTKPNPCSGHQQGRNRRRLKRPVICGNSATTVISPTQKPPKEKISNSSLEGAILSRSTEMTDSGATDSNTRICELCRLFTDKKIEEEA